MFEKLPSGYRLTPAGLAGMRTLFEGIPLRAQARQKLQQTPVVLHIKLLERAAVLCCNQPQ